MMDVGDWLLCLGAGGSSGSMISDGRVTDSEEAFDEAISMSSTSSMTIAGARPFVDLGEGSAFLWRFVGDSSSSGTMDFPFTRGTLASGDFKRLLLRGAIESRGLVRGIENSTSGGGRERLLP